MWWFSAKTPLACARIAIFPCFTHLCQVESKPRSMHNEIRINIKTTLNQKMLPSQMPLCQTIYMPGGPIVRSILVSIQSFAFSTSTQCCGPVRIQLKCDLHLPSLGQRPCLNSPFPIYIYIHTLYCSILSLSNYPKVVQNRWPGWQIMLDSD